MKRRDLCITRSRRCLPVRFLPNPASGPFDQAGDHGRTATATATDVTVPPQPQKPKVNLEVPGRLSVREQPPASPSLQDVALKRYAAHKISAPFLFYDTDDILILAAHELARTLHDSFRRRPVPVNDGRADPLLRTRLNFARCRPLSRRLELQQS